MNYISRREQQVERVCREVWLLEYGLVLVWLEFDVITAGLKHGGGEDLICMNSVSVCNWIFSDDRGIKNLLCVDRGFLGGVCSYWGRRDGLTPTRSPTLEDNWPGPRDSPRGGRAG